MCVAAASQMLLSAPSVGCHLAAEDSCTRSFSDARIDTTRLREMAGASALSVGAAMGSPSELAESPAVSEPSTLMALASSSVLVSLVLALAPAGRTDIFTCASLQLPASRVCDSDIP